MHVDLCIQLDEANDMSPDELAKKVATFQRDLGPAAAFSVEVTPVSDGVTFLAAMTKLSAEGTTLWAPNPPADATG